MARCASTRRSALPGTSSVAFERRSTRRSCTGFKDCSELRRDFSACRSCRRGASSVCWPWCGRRAARSRARTNGCCRRFADQIAAPLENAQLAAKLERAALLVENARLYEAERAARRDAEAAKAEAEKQRREAEAANRAKSEFIANMSHELRTPLNAIGGYVDLLEMGLRGDVTDAQREDLRRIHHAQRVLVGLVNDVLNFAKIEAGRLEFDIADVPVHEMLDSLEAFVMPQLVARSLHYVYEPVDPALAVSADREKLQQILLNLLSNAIKYTPSPGTIRVSVDSRRRRSALSRERHGPRHPERKVRPDFRAVRTRRHGLFPRDRRHRPGSRHQPRSGPHDGRRPHRRECRSARARRSRCVCPEAAENERPVSVLRSPLPRPPHSATV